MKAKDLIKSLIGSELSPEITKQAEIIAADESFNYGVKRQNARMFKLQMSPEDASDATKEALVLVILEMVLEAEEDPHAWEQYLPVEKGDMN